MSIDINKAINTTFKDPKWVQKLLIGGLFYFVIQFINSLIGIFNYISQNHFDFSRFPLFSIFSAIFFQLSILISLILLSAIPIGYVLQSVHNQIIAENEFLPEWRDNIYSYFINGLKYILIKFIYSFILFFLVSIPLILGISIFKIFIDNQIISYAGIILTSLVAVFVILGYVLILPLIFISFAENYVIQDSFNIKRMFGIFIKNINDFILCDLLVLAAFIIQILLSLLLVCTCIGILFIPFLYLPFFLIVMNLFTQAYLNAKSSV